VRPVTVTMSSRTRTQPLRILRAIMPLNVVSLKSEVASHTQEHATTEMR
jgi:hypothetical protein